ncbi:MAG: hypothetical protein KGI33_11435 [Thaumarchaeota archaeon]|nr:hypothetical protein [Nitrososphaerota archaeon]
MSVSLLSGLPLFLALGTSRPIVAVDAHDDLLATKAVVVIGHRFRIFLYGG